MISRDDKQLEIHNNILSQNVWSIFCGVPGFGKTRVGTNLIIECLKRNSSRIIHIIVPSAVLKTQWEKELKRLNLLTPKVYIINTYIKKNNYCDLLIADETLSVII